MMAHKNPRLVLILALSGVCLAALGLAFSQRQSAPLTDQQVNQLRDSAGNPPQRVKLYLGFIDERMNEIHRLTAASEVQSDVQAQESRMHDLYEEFTQISDELEDNLDAFDQQHADMRKILKTVVAESGKWRTALNELKPDSQDDFARKTALAAVESMQEDATEMLQSQEKYFSQHKTDSRSQ